MQFKAVFIMLFSPVFPYCNNNPIETTIINGSVLSLNLSEEPFYMFLDTLQLLTGFFYGGVYTLQYSHQSFVRQQILHIYIQLKISLFA